MVTGVLDTFIVEPFVPHDQTDEYYVCINSNRDGEEFLFCHEGGVDVGDVDAKADRLQVSVQYHLYCMLWCVDSRRAYSNVAVMRMSSDKCPALNRHDAHCC